jgi:hypothetical protein
MSDFDNLCEAAFEKRQELDNEARDATIDMHAANWINAVTKSPQRSHGTFKAVVERGWDGFERTEKIRPANSVDVFIEELENKDFMRQAALILINLHNGKSFTQAAVEALFKDMAANYAEFQYESNIKE